ncbi:MAG: HD domain-containing protein [Candidatus Marinimicrobia bacterium]|nr:HD domain-containing protein [Candidatus Neomarinimicrobiota bacterium]
MKLTIISEFTENKRIQGFYHCLEKHLRTTRIGDYYLDLLLQDASGRIHAKVWDNVEHFDNQFDEGDPVAVKALVERYNGLLQLNCTKITRATDERYGRYGFKESGLVPTITADRKVLWEELRRLVTAVKSKPLKALLRHIFKRYKAVILELPASFSYHHTERGGFLVHLVSTGQIAAFLAAHYEGIDGNLLIAGTLLHDIGKVKSVELGLKSDYTTEGQLVGHVILGRDVLKEALEEVDVPAAVVEKLEHIILAHQGFASKETPRHPRFPEALLVHYIDSMDGKLDLMHRESATDTGGGRFTSDRNYFRLRLYKSEQK